MLDMMKARVAGDYLQTAAIFDEQMDVLSLVTDPNDYAGPGTGYRADRGAPARDRRRPPGAVGRRLARRTASQCHRVAATRSGRRSPEPTRATSSSGSHPRSAGTIWTTLSGLSVADVLERAARRAGGGGLRGPGRARQRHDRPRPHRADGRAARPAPGIGDRTAGQGHGAHPPPRPAAAGEPRAVQRRADRGPPTSTGCSASNAGRHAKGATPEPARNPYTDEAIEARYHTKVVSLVAIERACTVTPRLARKSWSCTDDCAGRSGRRPPTRSPSTPYGLATSRSTTSASTPTRSSTRLTWPRRTHNPQLAANFRRAAELTRICPTTRCSRVYEALRPRRSSSAELEELAQSLETRGPR